MRVVVTGGLGFIGSAVIRHLLGPDFAGRIDPSDKVDVMNIDVETYASTRGAVRAVADSPRYRHVAVDIADGQAVRAVMADFAPDAVVHLAAETHVDRSIDEPGSFVRTNVVGTYELLETARHEAERRGVLDTFRFLHVSTDEVFGSLTMDDDPFTEATPYNPRSPYSASKAASDHFVRAWHETFGLATVITNCSNNYGPFQFPEKLIPLMILRAAAGEPLPVYGQGANVRDWLHVEDHARAIADALLAGVPGETYVVGGNAERSNLDVVRTICDLVDTELGDRSGTRRELITFVEDRPGHDLRYAIDPGRAAVDIGWKPSTDFDSGLRRTVRWYLDNDWWWRPLTEQRYDGRRLGTGSGARGRATDDQPVDHNDP